LVALGSELSPVVFTSWADDSVGGDSNGDGADTTPQAGDWSGISVSGSVSWGHVRVGFARSVSLGQSSGAGSVSVVDSVFEDVQYGLVVTGSSVAPRVQGNVFTRVGRASGMSTGYGRGSVLVYGDVLDPALLTGNSGSGNYYEGLGIGGTFAVDGTWPVQAGGWGTLLAYGYYRCGVTVPEGVEITVPAGTVVKSDYSCADLRVQGSLVALGSELSPVVFTSWADDSVGGDSNGDGADTTPQAGDWSGITVGAGGSLLLEGTRLKYASTAIYAGNDAEVVVRGAILDCRVGVQATEFVDAMGVDWGSPDGPAPGMIIGGSVLYSPWAGMVYPETVETDPFVPPPPPADCKPFAFIGARGSGEPPQPDDPNFPNYTDYKGTTEDFGRPVKAAFDAFAARVDELQPGVEVEPIPIRYPAMGVGAGVAGVPFPVNLLNPYYQYSIFQGALNIVKQVQTQDDLCGASQQVILAGYSQGALAVHLALNYLSAVEPRLVSSSKLAHVILFADPAKVPYGEETTWEELGSDGGGRLAGTGVTKAKGVWTLGVSLLSGSGAVAMVGLQTPIGLGLPLPSSVTSRTLAYCHNHDPVCAPGIRGAALSAHTYADWEAATAAEWVADRVAESSGW
jgi:hypothetical protein